MAISYLGVTAGWTDNGSYPTTSPVADAGGSMSAPLLGGLQQGDLILAWVCTRQAGAYFPYIKGCGGLNWNALGGQTGNNLLMNLYWAQYPATWVGNTSIDAQWGGNPGIQTLGATGCGRSTGTDASASNGMGLVCLYFRPTLTTATWSVDTAFTKVNVTAPASPFTYTITGITTTANSVAIAVFFSSDDNTWGNITGAGWVHVGATQWRNLAGSDFSVAFAYQLTPAGGATGNVTLDQLTLGGDNGMSWIGSFKEA